MTLKNPKFGNTFTLNTGVTIKRSLDGQLIVDAHKNILEAYNVSFEALTQVERDSLIDFFISTAGEEIQMQDHEGFNWLGIITTEQPTFRTDGRTCKYSTELSFEGRRV
jgi:hypothetical protein